MRSGTGKPTLEMEPEIRGAVSVLLPARRRLILEGLVRRGATKLLFVAKGDIRSGLDAKSVQVFVTNKEVVVHSSSSVRAGKESGAASPHWSAEIRDIRTTRLDKKLACVDLVDGRSIAIEFDTRGFAKKFVSHLNPAASQLKQDAAATSRHVVECTVIASHGHNVLAGDAVSLHIGDKTLRLIDLHGRTLASLTFDSIATLEVGGAGAVESGGGFMGGGFGLEGFVLGAAGAAVLNTLTKRRGVQTLARITTERGEIELFTDQKLPGELEGLLGPVRTAMRLRRDSESSAQRGSSTVEELTELARMHDDGILSDEEFAAAKRRLLS